MMNYILSEMRQKNLSPIKVFKFKNEKSENFKPLSHPGRTVKSDDFDNISNTKLKYEIKSYATNSRNNRIEESPKKSNIDKTKEFLKTYTSSLDIDIRRKILFTDHDYPLSLNKTERNNKYKTKVNFFKPVQRNIIEYINNGEAMINLFPDNYYRIINDKFEFKNNLLYQNTLKNFEDKIKNYENSDIISYSKGFKLKKFGKENIFLTIKSIKIKITNKKKNEKQEYFLPFNIIPFFYSISYSKFILFLAKLLEITKKNEIIFLKDEIKEKIEELVKIIKLFTESCSFYDKKSQEIRKFLLLFNHNIFSLEIIPPIIELKKTDGAKIIKIAGKALMIHLMENEFNNWEKSTLCYLSSIKSFRDEVHYIFQIKNNQKIVKIDPIKIKLLFKEKLNLDLIENKKEFSFLIQLSKDEKNEIFFFHFSPYIIEIIYEEMIKVFYLTFHEMRFLFNLIKKGYNLENIIYKCIIINEKKRDIVFSLNILNGFDIQKFENFFYQGNNNSFNSKIKLTIQQPTIEWRSFEDKSNTGKIELLKYNYQVPNSLLFSLLSNKFENWPRILNEYSEELFNFANEVNHKRRKYTLNTTGIVKSKKSVTNRRRTNKPKLSKIMKFSDN